MCHEIFCLLKERPLVFVKGCSSENLICLEHEQSSDEPQLAQGGPFAPQSVPALGQLKNLQIYAPELLGTLPLFLPRLSLDAEKTVDPFAHLTRTSSWMAPQYGKGRKRTGEYYYNSTDNGIFFSQESYKSSLIQTLKQNKDPHLFGFSNNYPNVQRMGGDSRKICNLLLPTTAGQQSSSYIQWQETEFNFTQFLGARKQYLPQTFHNNINSIYTMKKAV